MVYYVCGIIIFVGSLLKIIILYLCLFIFVIIIDIRYYFFLNYKNYYFLKLVINFGVKMFNLNKCVKLLMLFFVYCN